MKKSTREKYFCYTPSNYMKERANCVTDNSFDESSHKMGEVVNNRSIELISAKDDKISLLYCTKSLINLQVTNIYFKCQKC